jgi:hypothetical protein
MIMLLTAQNVHNTVIDCLFEEDTPENRARSVIVEGILYNFGFDPTKLEKHKEDIADMLRQLPPTFKQEVGGGWSFLNACIRAVDGVQWGEHRDMDALFSLGMAVGLVKSCLPREQWSQLPNGMPYYVILESPKKEEACAHSTSDASAS